MDVHQTLFLHLWYDHVIFLLLPIDEIDNINWFFECWISLAYMRKIHLGCGGGRCFQKQIINSEPLFPFVWQVRKKLLLSVSNVHMHTQGRRRRGRKERRERNRETELGNRIQKFFYEIILTMNAFLRKLYNGQDHLVSNLISSTYCLTLLKPLCLFVFVFSSIIGMMMKIIVSSS